MNAPASYAIALYPSLVETVPFMVRGATWPQIADCIGTHTPSLSKDSVPLFGPHDVLDGQGIQTQTLVSVSFGVLDLDKLTEDEVAGVVADIDGRVPYVLASTYSHSSTHFKARLMVPFSRPVLPSEWSRFWPIFNERFARGKADPVCKDATHRYYRPVYQEGGSAPPVYLRQDAGVAVDVDALLLDAAPAGFTGSATPTRADLRRLADRWAVVKGSRKEQMAKLAKAMRSVVKGDVFAEGGERNNTLFRLCSELVSRWPTLDPEEAAKLFSASLMVMGSDAPTTEQAADMMRRQQRGLVNQRASLIRDAFGTDRDTPYTPEELEGFAEMFGVQPSELRRRWIIQRGSSFYVFVNGVYRQYSEADVGSAAQRDLAPAITAQVDTNMATDKGIRPKTPAELVRDYGNVAAETEIDFMAQHSYYDAERFTFVEAPCPLRVQPEYSEAVAKFLELFAGPERHDRLLQWVAAVPLLDTPSAALYMEGPPGCGKSLLANGVAKMYSDRPTTLEEAMGTFNEAIMRCPVVFADETAPVDSRGRLRTEELREFIQARTRPLKRKYMPNATMKGAVRLILAANNRNLLQTTEHLTENDIHAIVERFFYLPVWQPSGSDPLNPPAREYLNQIVGPVEAARWITQDVIAKHAMWLHEHVEVPRTSRFLVSGEASDLTRSLTTGTGLRADVCHWLVSFLLDPKVFWTKSHVRHLVRVIDSRMYVNSAAISNFWDDYVNTETPRPSPTKVGRALAGLSSPTRVHMRIKGRLHAYREIVLDNLREWADATGYATEEALVDALLEIERMTANDSASGAPQLVLIEGGRSA